MRVVHISDLHIRNFKYRSEYREAFSQLYAKLDELRPDLVINTGDTVHSKLAVSPELFDDVADHIRHVTDFAPYWIILGNHDLNLKNKTRTDAISPVVRALQGRTRYELRMPECQPGGERMLRGQFPDFVFWHYDIRGHAPIVPSPEDINIGLYHGSISGCVTDIGFKMEEGESSVDRFALMDFVMMGDIHKRQSFREGRMQYPGSLIQQNYGEELVKGFLLWDIRSKDDWETTFYPLDPPGRFYTVQVPADLDLGGIAVPKGSRIRANVEGELTPSKRLELEKSIRERFEPLEVITPDSSGEKKRLDELTVERLVGSREQMMTDHLKDKGCSDEQIAEVLALWAQYEDSVEEDSARGSTWELKRLAWDNMLNYGEGNVIDLEKVQGLVGIFAPNASGKSSIFDILTEALFDRVTKDAPRNIDLINDNRDRGKMSVEFEANGTPYAVDRQIERISYGQRKLAEVKQWGKTTLDFSSVDDSLNGNSRPETERSIRSVIGTFEDFSLTTMVSQNPIFGLPGGGDIINCKETDRRKILFRFLDLDVYEKVHQLCKDELKGILGGIKNSDREAAKAEVESLDGQLGERHVELDDCHRRIVDAEGAIEALKQRLALHEAEKIAMYEAEVAELHHTVTTLENKTERRAEELRTIEKQLKDVNERHRKLLLERPSTPEFDLDTLSAKVEEVRAEEKAVGVELTRSQDALKSGKRALKTLEGVPCEGKFPTCRFISEAVGFLSTRESIEKAVEELEGRSRASEGELSTLKQYEVQHRAVRQWEQTCSEMLLAIERLNSKAKLAEKAFFDSNNAHQEAEMRLREVLAKITPGVIELVNSTRGEIVAAQRTVNEEKRNVEAKLRSIGALEAKRAVLITELAAADKLREKVAVYERLAEITGKDGLPYRILTLVLPVINSEIEKILGGIVKFNVFFEHDPDEQSISLYIRYGDYRSRPLSLGSGAEKFIASLAIRAALLSVSSLPKTDILIIDEGFGKLDPEHLESLQKMFEYLREAFGTVFIVSHVDFMRDIVDHSVEISSRDGYAHVDVS